MKNISLITSIQIVALNAANHPTDNDTGEILFDSIPDKANFVSLPITVASSSFLEEMTQTRAGNLYSKNINCRVPKHTKDFEASIKPFLNIPLVALIKDPNNTEQLIFPLLLSYAKTNPGTPVSYRGYNLSFTGSSNKPSFFIKKVAETPEVS